jgi:hypothetical protein
MTTPRCRHIAHVSAAGLRAASQEALLRRIAAIEAAGLRTHGKPPVHQP